MADAAIFGARQLIDAPLDPERIREFAAQHPFLRHLGAGARAVKFERWDEMLDGEDDPLARHLFGQGQQGLLRGARVSGQGRLDESGEEPRPTAAT